MSAVKSTPIAVMMGGAGSSGKTVLAKALCQSAPEGSIAHAPSFTRNGYEEALSIGMRVPNEKAALELSPEDAGKFQSFLFHYYIRRVNTYLQVAAITPGVRVCIFERMPFDHLAYIRSQCMVGNYDWSGMNKQAARLIEKVKPILVYLPDGAPWVKAGMGNDGFRKLDPAKERAFDCDLLAQLCSLKYKDTVYAQTYDLTERVALVRNEIIARGGVNLWQ